MQYFDMIDAPVRLQPLVPHTDGAVDNDDAVSLSLADLLPDSSGAIVIEGDGDDISIRILTDEPVIDAGVVEKLMTAAGEDVSGHTFFAFSNGTTLYVPHEVNLQIVDAEIYKMPTA